LLGGGSLSFAETFKALSDPVRRDILMLLRKQRLSAGEIGSQFDMTGATISYHLKVLKKAELVTETKEKNFVYYQLNTSVVEEVMLWLAELKGENHHAEEV
jgi:DNA-binding transcriptional ArsR family regulator